MVTPLALSPSVPPGLGPVDLLNAARAPFHVHLPHSYAMLVVHLHPSPKSAFSGDQWSVGEPAPRARTTGPVLVSVCPPSPHPVQLYLSRYPPDQRESIFVVVPLALSRSVPPGLGPVDLLTAVTAPFHVHPPHSYAMLVVRSHLALNRHIALIMRSMDEPAPRARPTGPRLPCLLTTGPCNKLLL